MSKQSKTTIWKHLSIVLVLFLITGTAIVTISNQKTERPTPCVFQNLFYRVAPYDPVVLNYTKALVNGTPTTKADILLIQKNISSFNITDDLHYPHEVIENQCGDIDSLHYLTFSALYNLHPYILLVDTMNDTATVQNHTAILLFHNNSVILLDFAIANTSQKIVCNFTSIDKLLYDLILHTSFYEYEIEWVLSAEEEQSFWSNTAFVDWAKHKVSENIKNEFTI